MRKESLLILGILLLVGSVRSWAEGTPAGIEIRRYVAPEARQAVAVDGEHIYAIVNRAIAKYRKSDGSFVKRWESGEDLPLVHLNSGIVLDGRLYAAHSNFPAYPEASSVEVWDAQSLDHIESHSLGFCDGSLTWIDWHEDAWWAVFAHYTEKVNDDPHSKDARWTSLVRFDRQWRRLGGWQFPEEVIASFEPHSCSGGAWGPDGRLYCTGHDRGEVFQLELPQGGSKLRLLRTFSAPFTGQGIAWDKSEPGVLYGIDRPRGEIIAVNFPMLSKLKLETARRMTVTQKSSGQLP